MKVSILKISISIYLLSAASLANPTKQEIVKKGKFNTGTIAYNLFLSGDYAYVTTNIGIAVINIQDKSNPVQVDIIKKKTALDIKGRDQKIYFITYGALPKNCTSQKVRFLAFKLLGKLSWGQVSERAVRPKLVVIQPPHLYFLFCVLD
jgi:hypothetical protein